MLFGVRSMFVAEVLDALEVRIAAGAGLPRERVFHYAGEVDELLAAPPAERFVAAWFTNVEPMMDYVDGGGAEWTAFNSAPRLDVFVRLGTDRELEDRQLMADRSLGYARFVYRVVKAVHLWTGSFDGETSGFLEPARLGSQGVTFNQKKPTTGWAWARVALAVKFRTDFTQD